MDWRVRIVGKIPMSSTKTAWVGSLEWSYSNNYVTVTMYTWKTDGYPSSAASGANFTATISIGGSTKTFSFQQQEKSTMVVGTLGAYVSGNSVYISGRVDAPYGVSMYGYPLTGGGTVTLYEEEDTVNPSQLSIAAKTVQMGGELQIYILPERTDCFHRLTFIAEEGELHIQPSENIGTGYLWSVPNLMAYCGSDLSCNVTVRCETYMASGKYAGRTEKEITVTAYPETVPACAGAADMGSTLAITLSRQCSQYVHDLSYTMGDHSGEIALGAEAACEWQVSLELAKLCPSKTAAMFTLVCVTRWESLEIGRKSIQVQLRVPDNEQTKPTGTMVLAPAGELPNLFAGMYIRGMTGVEARFTAASQYSQIAQCQLQVEGNTVTGNPACSAVLHSHGTVTVTGRIVDLRGYVRTITETIPVIAYDKPRVIPFTGESTVVAVRCDYPDGTRNPRGQSLLIRAGRKYTALNGSGGQMNFCSLSYRYKMSGSDVYSDYYDLIDAEDLTTDDVERLVENAVPELRAGYTVQLRAMDSLGSYSVITIPVAALTVPFHIGRGNSNVAVGKYCDYSRENAFEMGLTTYFDTGIALRPIFAEGQWHVGTELGSEVASADTGAVSRYSLFMAVCNGLPVWLMKLGTGIYGNGMEMTCSGSVVTLHTAQAPVTAMYAVL